MIIYFIKKNLRMKLERNHKTGEKSAIEANTH